MLLIISSSLVRSGGEQSAGSLSCCDFIITKRRYDAISVFSFYVISSSHFFKNFVVRNDIIDSIYKCHPKLKVPKKVRPEEAV